MANQYTKNKSKKAATKKAANNKPEATKETLHKFVPPDNGETVNTKNYHYEQFVKEVGALPPGDYIVTKGNWGFGAICPQPKMSKCDSKARQQPHFTLLAQDNFTPGLLRQWIEQAYALGTDEGKIIEAKHLLKRIEEWRTANPLACKTPD